MGIDFSSFRDRFTLHWFTMTSTKVMSRGEWDDVVLGYWGEMSSLTGSSRGIRVLGVYEPSDDGKRLHIHGVCDLRGGVWDFSNAEASRHLTERVGWGSDMVVKRTGRSDHIQRRRFYEYMVKSGGVYGVLGPELVGKG